MNKNFEHKISLVLRLDEEIDRLLHSHGTPLPLHYPGSPRNAVVYEKPPLVISKSPDRFRTIAAKSPTSIGESLLVRKDWYHVDLKLFGKRRLSYNISATGELVIYHFQPGPWMLDHFGVDPQGDHSPIMPNLFPEDQNPTWSAFKLSGLSKWPPQFDD
jgi:hypothetical protein